MERIRSFLGENWLPLLFGALIVLGTSIVVPILYSTKDRSVPLKERTYQWQSAGVTLLRSEGRFGEISALLIDSFDQIFLLDRTFGQILLFQPDKEAENLQILLSNRSGLKSPEDFSLDIEKNFYIADTGNNRIVRFTPSSVGNEGQQATLLDQLNGPRSVSVDLLGSLLYIAEWGNDRILRYNFRTKEIDLRLPSSFNGDRRGLFVAPLSIRFDSFDQTLLIAQENCFNVVRWDLKRGEWTLAAGSSNGDLNGTSRTLFNQICSIFADQLGHSYVVDCLNERIQMFERDLAKGRTIAGVIQAPGNNSYLFSHPTSIALDSKFNLYVADSLNYRIQFFLNRHS